MHKLSKGQVYKRSGKAVVVSIGVLLMAARLVAGFLPPP
jgi:hypothetical protein